MDDDQGLRMARLLMGEPSGWTFPVQYQQGLMPNANLSVQSRGIGAPQISGGLSTPMFGGELGVSGSYQAQKYPGADWSALAKFLKRF